MVRKISFAILSVTILVTGVIALRKLNYWESSVWIFKLNSGQLTEGRIGHAQGDGRGHGGFRDQRRPERAGGNEGQQRPGERIEGLPMRELPDSIRERFAGRGHGMRDRNFPDSLTREFPREFSGRSGKIPTDEGFSQRGGRGRGEFGGEKKINLGNVLCYLAVFASFTVAAIYTDKCLRLIRKSKKTDLCQ